MTFPAGGITNFLRGIGGEFEITRVVGAFGSFTYIIGTHVFIAWNMIEGREFDLTAYCIAFPSGLGVVVGATATAAAIKDRNVAVAKATEAKTKRDSAGDGTRAIDDAKDEAAEQVAEAAADEKDKITGASQR